MADVVLPYRTDGTDLVQLIDARGRGRALDQIRAATGSAKNYEGTLATAYALGLLETGSGELSATGRALALAGDAERRSLMRAALRGFEPYARLLDEVFSRAARQGETPSTETAWVEMWWGTHGYGSSQSNRAEGAATLARLLEYAGMASYVQGRRGHPSRIAWEPGAASLWRGAAGPLTSPPSRPAALTREPEAQRMPGSGGPPAATHVATPAPAAPSPLAAYQSELSVELGPGRVARLQVPAALTAEEKSRLLALVDLLVRVESRRPPAG